MHPKQIFEVFVWVVLITTWISCSSNQDNDQKKRLSEINFVEKLSIVSVGEEFETKFDRIYDLAVGPNGNIYVADASRLKIFKYSPDGEFLTSFGKEGKGPGELVRLKGFEVIDSTVHVWDRNIQRMNNYDLHGNYKDQILLKGIASPVEIVKLGQQRLLLYPERYQAPFSDARLAHLYNSDFVEDIAHFIKVGEINHGLEDISRIINTSISSSVEFISSNRILYAPVVYNNIIFEYKLDSLVTWTLTAEHKGLYDQKPFTMVESKMGRKPDVSYHSVNLNEPLEIIAHNQSRGLYKVQDYIFHFVQIDIGEKREFGAEVYSENFDPIGFIPIKSIPITTGDRNTLVWSVEEADNNGNFYFRENYPDGSRLRKMYVNLEQLNGL